MAGLQKGTKCSKWAPAKGVVETPGKHLLSEMSDWLDPCLPFNYQALSEGLQMCP